MPPSEASKLLNLPSLKRSVCENRRSVFLSKVCQKDLVSAIRAAGLRDGMTISFHHCFREGDYTVRTCGTCGPCWPAAGRRRGCAPARRPPPR